MSLVTLTCYKAANTENEYSGAELAVQRRSATVPLSGKNPDIIWTNNTVYNVSQTSPGKRQKQIGGGVEMGKDYHG